MTEKDKTEKKSTLHRWSHAGSLACAVHCILAPLLIVFVPFLGDFFQNKYLEFGLLAFSILCGAAIIFNGFCTHKRKHIGILFLIGISFWGMHGFFGHQGHEGHAHHWEIDIIFLIVGTGFVLGSYYLNHRQLKCCPCDGDH